MFAPDNSSVNTEKLTVKSASQINVDPQQIQQHLQLLGFKPDEDVFLRCFYPKDDPRREELDSNGKKKTGARKVNFKFKDLDKITAWCNREQRDGKAIYLVVNGQGQSSDKITQGRALFYEHDEISLEESENYWQKLQLPEPTFQVYTGGKSIHTYWVLDFPIAIGDWQEAIKDLAAVSKADVSNVDPPRLLRLAGCYHVHLTKQVNDQAKLINISNSTYNADILRAYITDACSRDVDIWGWMPDMMRYLEGYTEGARDGWVVAKCPTHNGESTDSLHANIHSGKFHCWSHCDPTEIFWDVFEESKKRGNPKLQDLEKKDLVRLVAASISEKIASEQDGSKQTQAAKKNKNVYNFPVAKDGLEPIETVIRDYLENENPTRREKILYIKSLVEDYGYRSDKVVHELFAAIQREIDQAEQQEELYEKVDELLKIDRQCLDIDALFPGKLSRELKKAAYLLDTPVEPLVTLLLPTLGSLVSPQIKVKAWEGFTQYINLWGYMNAETGESKTPIFDLIVDPLRDIQKQIFDEYALVKAHYEEEIRIAELNKDKEALKELEKNPPATPRDLYFSSVTLEAIAVHLAQHKSNALIARDELIGLFKSLGQYKGGKGDDAEELLQLYNGQGIKKNTKTAGNAFARIGGMSIIGGLHPDELGKLLCGDDSAGLMARACICTFKRYRSDDIDYTVTHDLVTELARTYKDFIKFNSLGSDEMKVIKLDMNAFAIFNKYYKWNDLQLSKADSPALKAVFNKNAGKVLRFAGLLHILDCVNKGEELGEIDGATITKAIGLTHYYSQQFVSLYASHGHGSSNALDIKKVLYYLGEQENQEASINQIRKYCLQRRDPNHFAEVCEQLIALGHCTKHKKGKSWILRLVEERGE